ncbi:MAG: S41 family peptidase, partial [Bacteroidales bacterium]
MISKDIAGRFKKILIRSLFFTGFMTLPLFIFSQTGDSARLDISLIKADIDTLITTLLNVHPTFASHYRQNNLELKIDSIKNSLTEPMLPLDFYRMMQPVIAIDGHTTLIYTGEVYPKIKNPFFPFKVVIHNNNLYIKENLSENQELTKGTGIEKINGIPAQHIIQNLLRYMHGEMVNYKTKSLENSFHIYYRLVYGSFSNFEVTVNNIDYDLKGTDWSGFKEPSKPNFELRFYDDDIAYLYKRSFKPPKDFIHFMDSAFKLISEKQIHHLIIDNRRGGGLGDMADSLLACFSSYPYNLYEKKSTKISHLTNNYIELNKSSGLIKNGNFVQEFNPHQPFRVNHFKGNTYIMVGALSYSLGTCFPASAKCYKNAIIVGEETGQPLLSNGDINSFRLENTQILCYTSMSIYSMPCHNNDTLHGVMPDYIVTPGLNEL